MFVYTYIYGTVCICVLRYNICIYWTRDWWDLPIDYHLVQVHYYLYPRLSQHSPCYRPILIFPDFSLFSLFSRATFAFSPYLLTPITWNHQMLKFPHSPDPFASWVPYVLQCASCPTHVCLMFASPITHDTQPCTCSPHDPHMRTAYLTLPSWLASIPLHGCTDTPVILMDDSWRSHVA